MDGLKITFIVRGMATFTQRKSGWYVLVRRKGHKTIGRTFNTKNEGERWALGFWKAVAKIWSDTDQQRCWVHKTANVLEKLPKALQPKVKEALHNIW